MYIVIRDRFLAVLIQVFSHKDELLELVTYLIQKKLAIVGH